MLSLRSRLTAWYTIGLSVTLLSFGALLERALTRDLRAEFDEHLESAAGVATFAVQDMIRDLGVTATRTRLLHGLRFIDLTVAIRVDGGAGASTWLDGSDPVLTSAPGPPPCASSRVSRQRLGDAHYRALVHCVPAAEPIPGLAIVVGAPELELVMQRRRVRGIVAGALLVGLVITTLGGHWLSGRAIRPIRRIARQLEDIGSEDLDRRLPVHAGEGEIAELSRRVNALFDRLATSVGRERQFLANAAHALRTPVAELQGEVSETALAGDLTGEARAGLTQIALLTTHLGRTVDYLLSLSRRQAGADAFPREAFYLDDVVSGTVARFTRTAAQRNVRLAWAELEEVPVLANPHAVEQITQILVENGLQYTPAGGTVTVAVRRRDGSGELIVEDTGPGFAPGEIPILFAPFVRGSAARHSGAPGSGLGLAVARWMVEACRGTIRAESLESGARFVVELPAPDRHSAG